MIRIRLVSLAVAVVLLMASTGRTQPQTAPTPLLVALVPYIGDEGIQKELKLSEEQKKKLLEARQKSWDDAWNQAPSRELTTNLNKALESVFKEVLSPEQQKRAEQLATQLAWRRFASTSSGTSVRSSSATVLIRYPQIAEALKLDETQKKLLAARTAPGNIYLTPEQSEIASTLLGEAYTGTFRQQRDPRAVVGGFVRPGLSLPMQLQYATAPDVQKELGLSEEQKRSLSELVQKFGERASGPNTLNRAEAQKAAEARAAEIEKEFAKVLAEKQLKRLKQIALQQETGPDDVTLASSILVKELGVTEEQQQKLAAVRTAFSEKAAKIITTADSAERAQEAIDAATKERAAAVDAILTEAQRAKRTDLLGETFAGNVFGGFRGGSPFGSNPTMNQMRQYSFGRYSGQLTVLNTYKSLRDELKLTEEQAEKIAARAQEQRVKFPIVELMRMAQDEKEGDKFFAEQSAYVEKALEELLTKEQRARFRELQLQQLEARRTDPRGVNPGTTASYPGVAEAIKLTAEQRKKLIEGDAPAEVLTAEQKKAIEGMLGTKADLAVVFSRPDFGVPPGGFNPSGPAAVVPRSEVNVLFIVAVWDELKLDRGQVAKLVSALNEYNLANPAATRGGGRGGPPVGGFPGGPQSADVEKVKAAVEALEKSTDGLLTAEQKVRTEQLAMQQMLARGLDSALTRATAVSKALAPTADQMKAIASHADKFRSLSAVLSGVDLEPEKFNAVRTALSEKLEAAIMGELTADQKAKLEKLTGPPFKGILRLSPFGEFGGGGFSPFQ